MPATTTEVATGEHDRTLESACTDPATTLIVFSEPRACTPFEDWYVARIVVVRSPEFARVGINRAMKVPSAAHVSTAFILDPALSTSTTMALSRDSGPVSFATPSTSGALIEMMQLVGAPASTSAASASPHSIVERAASISSCSTDTTCGCPTLVLDVPYVIVTVRLPWLAGTAVKIAAKDPTGVACAVTAPYCTGNAAWSLTWTTTAIVRPGRTTVDVGFPYISESETPHDNVAEPGTMSGQTDVLLVASAVAPTSSTA